MKKFTNSKPFQNTVFRQLIFFTIGIGLIPTLLITCFLYYKMGSYVEDELHTSYEQLVNQYVKNIEEKLIQYQKSLYFIADNTTIKNILLNKDGNYSTYVGGNQISREVTKSLLLDEQSEIRNCVVYSNNKDAPVYGSRVSMIGVAHKETWYLKKEKIVGNFYFYRWPNESQTQLSFIEDINEVNIQEYNTRLLGIVKLDINANKLFAPAISNAEGKRHDVVVYTDTGKILYASGKEGEAFFENYFASGGISAAEGENAMYHNKIASMGSYLIADTELETLGLHVMLRFGNSELKDRKNDIYFLISVLVSAVIVSILICAYHYSDRFALRVSTLLRKIRCAEMGDFSVKDPISGKDEIAQLDRAFSQMLEQIDKLIQKNYIQELQNKETQLRNLQLQINPHFLYNTLETISSMAAVKQVFDICDMCEKLGEIFRYSLGKNYGEFVTVEEELHHTQNYIYIQKVRYDSKFEVFYHIQPEIKNCMMLRFILQPIVENAIVHGLLSMTTEGIMDITLEEKENKLLIRIEDNGVGMEQVKVEELMAFISTPEDMKDKKGSIGIRNVNQRIKYSCGQEYGITVDSRPWHGSCFSIWLPLLRKGGEKNEIQPSDC